MDYLIIDIGNTNIVMAVFDGKKIKQKWRISSFLNRTKDEYILWLKYIIDQNYTFKDIIEVTSRKKSLFTIGWPWVVDDYTDTGSH